MPDFQPHDLDVTAAWSQVKELQAMLEESNDIAESDFHDFFEPRADLRALVGRYNPWLGSPDRLAWQYPIFGDFRSDFAIGDWARKAYTFVEYEDARPNSLFVKQGDKATRAWASHFERGFSQIVDWFYKLQVMTNSEDMEARFGKRAIRYIGVLVIGREQHLREGERLRLDWRQDHVIVNSKQIVCDTNDQLVADLLYRLGNDRIAGNGADPD